MANLILENKWPLFMFNVLFQDFHFDTNVKLQILGRSFIYGAEGPRISRIYCSSYLHFRRKLPAWCRCAILHRDYISERQSLGHKGCLSTLWWNRWLREYIVPFIYILGGNYQHDEDVLFSIKTIFWKGGLPTLKVF